MLLLFRQRVYWSATRATSTSADNFMPTSGYDVMPTSRASSRHAAAASVRDGNSDVKIGPGASSRHAAASALSAVASTSASARSGLPGPPLGTSARTPMEVTMPTEASLELSWEASVVSEDEATLMMAACARSWPWETVVVVVEEEEGGAGKALVVEEDREPRVAVVFADEVGVGGGSRDGDGGACPRRELLGFLALAGRSSNAATSLGWGQSSHRRRGEDCLLDHPQRMTRTMRVTRLALEAAAPAGHAAAATNVARAQSGQRTNGVSVAPSSILVLTMARDRLDDFIDLAEAFSQRAMALAVAPLGAIKRAKRIKEDCGSNFGASSAGDTATGAAQPNKRDVGGGNDDRASTREPPRMSPPRSVTSTATSLAVSKALRAAAALALALSLADRARELPKARSAAALPLPPPQRPPPPTAWTMPQPTATLRSLSCPRNSSSASPQSQAPELARTRTPTPTCG